jgi:hypothetical protein
MCLIRACFGFFVIQDLFALNPSEWRYIFDSRLHSTPLGPKKLLFLIMNGVLCYYPQTIVLQRNVRVFGRNIDKSKVEVKIGVKHFLIHAFEKFYIIIWSCMKLEDVLKVFPMLISDMFLDQFVFIWGHEQCLKTYSQISPRFYYYLMDLKHVYYGCHGLFYEKEYQTLLINNKPNKTFRNSKWNGFFLESFRCELLSNYKVQLLDLVSHLWLALIKLPSTNTIWDHMMFWSRIISLSYFLWNYFWFMQYMNYDNGDLVNAQPYLAMHFESFHLFSFLIFQVISYFICWKNYVIYIFLLALKFVYNWLCLLFTNCAIVFVALNGWKQCLPLRFLFRDNANIITYLTMDHHKSSKKRRNWFFS